MFNPSAVKYVSIEVPVSDDEDIPNDFPGRKGNMLKFVIEHPTGKIVDFDTGYKFSNDWLLMTSNSGISPFLLFMKVTDEGTYILLDKDKNPIASIEEDYVPDKTSIPGEYGDYLDLSIDLENGIIENWYGERATFDEFQK
jgi:hypothetical protein